eukprot:2452813-Prymnesium_polylepis.1
MDGEGYKLSVGRRDMLGMWAWQRSPRPRATGPRLVLRRAATDNSAAARVWQIQIFCPRVESERHALTNVQPAPRRRGKRVIECAVHGEHNGAATAVWRHIVLKERLVEQVDLPAVNLRMLVAEKRATWERCEEVRPAFGILRCAWFLLDGLNSTWSAPPLTEALFPDNVECTTVRFDSPPTWIAPPFAVALLAMSAESSTRTLEPPVTRSAPPDCAELSRMVHATRVRIAECTPIAPVAWPRSETCRRST